MSNGGQVWDLELQRLDRPDRVTNRLCEWRDRRYDSPELLKLDIHESLAVLSNRTGGRMKKGIIVITALIIACFPLKAGQQRGGGEGGQHGGGAPAEHAAPAQHAAAPARNFNPPVGVGHVPARGPAPSHTVAKPAVPPRGGAPSAPARSARVPDQQGHPAAPHVDANTDRWVGHDGGKNNPT